MCCFTRPVKRVSETNIFARMDKGNRQFLVYSMTLEAKQDLAMVLPIPVARGSGEKAVHFISLEKYPNFFENVASAFPTRGTKSKLESLSTAASTKRLEVVQVGSFEASFAPTVGDFERLDERFRLSPNAFKQLPPLYRDFGFAVFKLKPGEHKVHPMAFSFPTALPSRLFFPTVHIHDGKVHDKARFDHVLYCQSTDALRLSHKDWEESESTAHKYVDIKKCEGVVEPNEHFYKQPVRGMLANTDRFAVALA